jgi:hypothetical protein
MPVANPIDLKPGLPKACANSIAKQRIVFDEQDTHFVLSL